MGKDVKDSMSRHGQKFIIILAYIKSNRERNVFVFAAFSKEKIRLSRQRQIELIACTYLSTAPNRIVLVSI